MSVNDTSLKDMSVDDIYVDDMSIKDMSVDDMSVDDMSVDDMSGDDMSVDEMFLFQIRWIVLKFICCAAFFHVGISIQRTLIIYKQPEKIPQNIFSPNNVFFLLQSR